LKHTGTYVFDYQTQDKLYADLHQIALANQASQTSQPALANQPQLVNPAQSVTPADPAPTEPVAVEATVIATNKATEETATAD